jgi:hypothetical protein
VLGIEGEKADYVTQLLCSSILKRFDPIIESNKSEISCQTNSAEPAI